MGHFGIDHLIGSALVAILAVRRFNTPPTNRSSTTAPRYHFAQLAYCGFLVVAFLALSRSSNWLTFLGGEPGTQSDAGPIFAALLLVTLQSNAPVVREVDQWLRDRFHDLAAIPSRLDQLTDRMREAAPFLPESVRSEVRNTLSARGIKVEDAWYERPGTPLFTLLRVTMLWLQVRGLTHRRLASLGVSEDQAHGLEERYEALADKALAVVPNSACTRCQAAFELEANDLFRDLRRIVGQEVLRFHASRRRREERLRQLGFRLRDRRTLTVNQMLGVCFAIFAIAFFGFFGTPEGSDLRIASKLRIISTIVISWMSILAILHWLHLRFPDFSGRDEAGGRPWGFYLLAALGSGLLAQLLQGLIQLALTGQLNPARGLEWRLLTFSGALLTAFHIHNRPRPGLRWIEAGSEGVVMAAMGWFVTAVFIPDVSGREFGPIAVARTTVMNALFGAVVGYFIPHWFRTSDETLFEDEEEASGDKGEAQLHPLPAAGDRRAG